VDRNIDIVPHQESAALEHGIPRQAEVFPFDRGTGARASPELPIRILDLRRQRAHLESDFAGDSTDCKIARQIETTVGAGYEPGRLKCYGRITADIQEVATLEMLVPL